MVQPLLAAVEPSEEAERRSVPGVALDRRMRVEVAAPRDEMDQLEQPRAEPWGEDETLVSARTEERLVALVLPPEVPMQARQVAREQGDEVRLALRASMLLVPQGERLLALEEQPVPEDAEALAQRELQAVPVRRCVRRLPVAAEAEALAFSALAALDGPARLLVAQLGPAGRA